MHTESAPGNTPPATGEYRPRHPKRFSHRIFDWLSPALVAAAIGLIGLSVRGATFSVPRLQLAAAALLLCVVLLVALVLLHKDEEVEGSLRGELLETEQSGRDARSELLTLGTGYQYLFKTNPIPMWIFDVETLRFLEVNDAALAQYGYSRYEFLRMSIHDIRNEEESQRLLRALQAPQRELEQAGSWRHRKKNGMEIDVEVTAHGLIWQGRQCRFVCATDVTHRLFVERALTETNLHLDAMVHERTEKLRKRTLQLQRRKQELEELNAELEAFSSAASHDLRTPLFVINTFTRMLGNQYGETLGPQGREYLEKIAAGCGWMSSLIDSLLKLAHASRRPLTYSEVDLSTLAEEIASTYRIRDPGRDVSVAVEPGLVVQGDRELLKIALENLFGNAWKFTSRTTNARIAIGTEAVAHKPALFIRDNGPGFDMRHAAQVFRTFKRLHTEEEFAGHGIGLSTVQRIVQRHGGRIWAEAEQGRGATFYFTLKSRQDQKKAHAAMTLPESDLGRADQPTA